MKKKILCYVMCVLMIAMLLTGCQEQKKTSEYADDNFIADLSNGLVERWKIVDKDENDPNYDKNMEDASKIKEMRQTYIKAEQDYINKYQDKKFKDSKLHELALSYINVLNDSKDALKYIEVDYDMYADKWDEAYNTRANLITQLTKEYNLTVPEKYQDELDNFVTTDKIVQENKTKEDAISKLLRTIQFQETEAPSETNGFYGTYVANIQNNTGIDFATFQIDINLLDENDTILETQYYSVSNLKNGQTAQASFSTDKQFKSTDITCSYWEEAQ